MQEVLTLATWYAKHVRGRSGGCGIQLTVVAATATGASNRCLVVHFDGFLGRDLKIVRGCFYRGSATRDRSY